MKKESKENWGLALAAAGLAAMILLQQRTGAPELGGSGGGLAGDTGLPPIPGTGGGGQDRLVINLDFPPNPPITIPDENPPLGPAPEPTPDQTKKEKTISTSGSLPPWEAESIGTTSQPFPTSTERKTEINLVSAVIQGLGRAIGTVNPVGGIIAKGIDVGLAGVSSIQTTKKSASTGSTTSLPQETPQGSAGAAKPYSYAGASFGSSPVPSFTSLKIAAAVEKYGSVRYSRPGYAPTKKESSSGGSGGTGGSGKGGMNPPTSGNSYWTFS